MNLAGFHTLLPIEYIHKLGCSRVGELLVHATAFLHGTKDWPKRFGSIQSLFYSSLKQMNLADKRQLP